MLKILRGWNSVATANNSPCPLFNKEGDAIMKNHSRAFGGNRKGPGYRTPSSFRAQVSQRRLGKKNPDIHSGKYGPPR